MVKEKVSLCDKNGYYTLIGMDGILYFGIKN